MICNYNIKSYIFAKPVLHETRAIVEFGYGPKRDI